MAILLGIGFVAGVITAVSPCVFPVLPILLAGGASGTRRRPFAIIGGLVASFAVFTLFAAWVLDRLGLPKDLLRNIAIGLLFLLAATLVLPRLGELLERPLTRLSRRRGGDLGGGFLLGVSLGLVFVPCAGPVLAAITAQAASLDFGWRTIALTLAYSLGAALPMLAVAVGGQRAAARLRSFRTRAPQVRAALGVVIAAAAVAILFDVDRKLQTRIGDYTGFFQRHVEETATARHAIARLRGETGGVARAATAGIPLHDFGPAPGFERISEWLNTPGGRPLTLGGLRGKVVLVDFWTYSCINCLRTLPHLRAWYDAYRDRGFVIVGVHTPEFAFEHVPSNVRAATTRLGVTWPVALDNRYGTWNAYSNQYWPAEYLLDKRGHVRHAHFGEGEYGFTEKLIRQLLGESTVRLAAARVPDTTPREPTTPELYLGSARLEHYSGSAIVPGRFASYEVPTVLTQNELAYGGRWKVERERVVAGKGAFIDLHFHARRVYIVVTGRGFVDVTVNGRHLRRVSVTANKLYALLSQRRALDGNLRLRFSPGLAAYSFTFG